MIEDRPVVMMSISIIPVSGSVADLRVAKLIREIAYSTSSTDTSLLRRILAKASPSRIIDSKSLGVALIEFKFSPYLLILVYSALRRFPACSLRIGCSSLAKEMNLASFSRLCLPYLQLESDILLCAVFRVYSVDVQNVCSDLPVFFLRRHVQQDVQQVETRKQRRRQIDVLDH